MVAGEIPLELFVALYEELGIKADSLVRALYHGRYDLADEIHERGVRLSFPREMIRSTTSAQIRWIIGKHYKLGAEGFIWAMGHGGLGEIIDTWTGCELSPEAYHRAVSAAVQHKNDAGIAFVIGKLPMTAIIIRIMMSDYANGLAVIDNVEPFQPGGLPNGIAGYYRATECIKWLRAKQTALQSGAAPPSTSTSKRK